MITRTRRTVLVAMLIALIVPLAFTARPALAVITISQTLATTSNDFAAGRFGLTGLAQNGGVQLVPLGLLRQWQQHPNNLCRPIGYMGAAVFKQNVYLVGGATSSGGTPSNLTEVCRNKVTGIDATMGDWTTNPAEKLPVKRRSLAAVAVAQPSDPNKGFLYAIGGLENATTSQSDVIWRAGINADGSLTGWITETVHLPTPRQDISATSFTTDGGTTYIYVIGGYQKPFVPTFAYRDVLRYEVSSTGALIDRSTGVPPVPIPTGVIAGAGTCEDKVGIKDTDALTMDVATTDAAGLRSVLMVLGGIFQLGSGDAGGCTAGTAVSARVFMAEINQTTGNLTWQTAATQEYTLPEPLSGTRAVGINGKIYAAGGLLGVNQDSATNNTYSSYVKVEDLTLPNFGPTSNFQASNTAMPTDDARGGHALKIVEVPTGTNPPTRPILLAMGGTDGLGGYRNDTLYGFVGLDTDTELEGDYAGVGVYMSPAYTLRGVGAVTEMQWDAAIATAGEFTTDIQIQYRLAASATALSTAEWVSVDGNPSNASFFSVNGANVGTTTSASQGRFLQYRAFLSTSLPNNRAATPVLRGPIKVKYTIDGHPSLYVKSGSFPTIVVGTQADATIRIANNTPPNSTRTETVLDADIEASGSFFVDLYAFRPGTTVVTPTRDPVSGAYPLTSAAFAEISRAALPAGNEIVVPPTIWKQNCGPTASCPAANWQLIFNRSGNWTVIAIVDSQNNVNEADTLAGEWERDNAFRFTVSSNVEGTIINWPIAIRNESPTSPRMEIPTRRPNSPEFSQP